MILTFPLVHKVHHLLNLWHPSPAGDRERESENRRYIAWAIASAICTPGTSAYSNSNEWWRRWSVTTREETTGAVQIAWASKSPRTGAASSTLWLLQNLMMYQMRTLQIWIPHHHQLDRHQQLNGEVPPEDKKDLDRVSECLHIHLRMPASSHNLLYLLAELSRPRQLRAKMKIQQLWIHKIA